MNNTKTLNVILWIVQVLLGGMYLMAGVMKSTTPMDALHQQMSWTLAVPDLMVRVIGISELLGGVGLLLPSLLRIRPSLTPLASLLLTLVQILALAFHVSRGEVNMLPVNIVMALLSTFVWWGRSKARPIQAKA